jgi:hypothetical protein
VAYRDQDPELARRAVLVSERDALARGNESVAARERIDAIDDELHAIDVARRAQLKARLPLMLAARAAKACGERWETMVGDGAVRTCARCDQPVFDLALMTLAQAETFLSAAASRAKCVRAPSPAR